MIKRFIIGLFLVGTTTISAQRNSASPYSYFGIGENFDPVTVEQSSMGGIGVALKDSYHLNFTNPAANADLRYATYALGGNLTFLTLKEAQASQSGNSTSLRYVSLGFPIGKKAGFSAGLQPFSSVGYSLVNRIYDGSGNISSLTKFTGSGGTNRLYGSFGMYVLDGLSLGLEASFIFGNIENSIVNQRSGVMLATKQEEKLNIKGGQFKFGAQYKRELKNKLELSTGASVTFESDLSARGNERLYSLTFASSGAESPKKLSYDTSVSGNITLPFKAVFGVGLGKHNKWYVGLNQEYREAIANSSGINTTASSFQYEKGNKFSLGGYYIPKKNSISSYWDRVVYRAGVRFEKIGVLADGTGTGQNLTSINDFGINVGFGLPLPKQLSNVNLGFEYGQRGTTNNNLIKENYFNIKLSLSLNSFNWFQKRKID
ncbi:putative outer membrane protein [Tenacibaculum sp. 190524A02b]|uniref:Long-subunit fatty acid transport protein n=1 Tax=Tenacibaculum vairaonense TaxID=3137860 RepID=A0ABM9PNF7_9FLAO